MGISIGSLLFNVKISTKEFDSAIQRIQRNLNKMSRKVEKVGKELSTKLTAPLLALGTASVIAFGKQEEAEMRLASAIKASGQAVDSTLAKYKALAAEMQKLTTHGDEEVLSLMQLGTSMGVHADEMEVFVKGTLGLADAFGKSTTEVSRAVARALNGDFEMLNEMSPKIKAATTQAEKAKIAFELMGDSFGISIEKAKTFNGSLMQLYNRIGDIGKRIGALLMPYLNQLIAVADGVISCLERMDKAALDNWVTLGLIASALGPVIIGLSKMMKLISLMLSPVSILTAAILGAVAAIGALTGATKSIGKIFGLEKLAAQFDNLVLSAMKWAVKIPAFFLKNAMKQLDIARAALASLETFIFNTAKNGFAKLKEWSADFVNFLAESLESVINSFIRKWNKLTPKKLNIEGAVSVGRVSATSGESAEMNLVKIFKSALKESNFFEGLIANDEKIIIGYYDKLIEQNEALIERLEKEEKLKDAQNQANSAAESLKSLNNALQKAMEKSTKATEKSAEKFQEVGDAVIEAVGKGDEYKYSDEAKDAAQKYLDDLEAGKVSGSKTARLEAQAIVEGRAITGESVRFKKYATARREDMPFYDSWMGGMSDADYNKAYNTDLAKRIAAGRNADAAKDSDELRFAQEPSTSADAALAKTGENIAQKTTGTAPREAASGKGVLELADPLRELITEFRNFENLFKQAFAQ